MSEAAIRDLLVAIGGGGGLLAIWRVLAEFWRQHRDGRRDDETLRVDITERLQRMADQALATMEARLVAAETAATQARMRADEIERKAAEAKQQAESLRVEVDEIRADRDQLLGHLVSVHDWIDGGAKPPPPTRPVWLRRRT